jgi:tetratricopeptide (TPR) repeat protein
MVFGLTTGARFRKILILSGALALFTLQGFGQRYEFTPACEKAYRSVLLFRFAEAGAILEKEKAANPGNLFPVYIENYIDFLILFTGEDKGYFDLVKSRTEKRLSLLAKGDKSSPYYRFCLADINIQWALARVKFREFTAAGLGLKRANDLIRENQALHPGFVPGQLGLGIMHALSGVVPENYRWLANLVGFEGDIEQGVAEMTRVVNYRGNDRFTLSLRVPACIITALIQATLRNDPVAALDMIGRFEQDPDLVIYNVSPLVIYARTSICLKTGRNEKALAALESRRDGPDVHDLSFLDYMTGVALLNNLDPGASVSFGTFLSEFTGGNYIKSALQKIAWTSLVSGDTSGYHKYIRRALTEGTREVDEDKQAYAEASSGVVPNVPLLRARLLSDGGYYNRALDLLLNRSLKEYIRNKRDLAEYYYRLGRIYQALDQDARAVHNYRLAVLNGKNLPAYYAAGAALQMGIIHERNKAFPSADSCFRLCLSLDYEEYKTSLSQKARAGLNRVRPELR